MVQRCSHVPLPKPPVTALDTAKVRNAAHTIQAMAGGPDAAMAWALLMADNNS